MHAHRDFDERKNETKFEENLSLETTFYDEPQQMVNTMNDISRSIMTPRSIILSWIVIVIIRLRVMIC